MLMSRTIVAAKRKYLSKDNQEEVLENFTIDSPVPFFLAEVIAEIERLDIQMVPGTRPNTEKQGPFNGKLSRLVERLQNKQTDRRLGFLFQAPKRTMDFEWLNKLVTTLVAGTKDQPDKLGGLKIVDFSEVPSDILPLIISLVAKLVFSIQQWTPTEHRHPIALFCDEAHLYIPERQSSSGIEGFAVKCI